MILLQLLVLISGLFMYVLASNSKIQEVGRIMFAVGTLAFLLGGKLPFVG